jgi:hypothetical protein
MDKTEVLAVWYLSRKAKKCNRKLWVHPINQSRGEFGFGIYNLNEPLLHNVTSAA